MTKRRYLPMTDEEERLCTGRRRPLTKKERERIEAEAKRLDTTAKFKLTDENGR
jgi:hypothetical protein